MTPPGDQTKQHQAWIYIMIGAMLALQVVQFVMIGLLYLYIHSIEGRIETDIRENGKEIIRFIDKLR